MDKSALIVQYRKREKLIPQLVGTLYPGIVVDEMCLIEELLRPVANWEQITGKFVNE